MLTVTRKSFSLIFVSKKQKLKLSHGGEAPAEATSAFEMVPTIRLGLQYGYNLLLPSGVFGGTSWLQPKTCVFRPISGASASF